MNRFIAENEDVYDKSFVVEEDGHRWEETPDDYLERIRHRNIKGYAVQIQHSGQWAEVKVFPIWKKRSFVPHAGEKSKETQKALNFKNAVRRLTRLLNHNFRLYEDWFCTYTADNNHLYLTEEECFAAAGRALNRIRYRYHRYGIPLKAVYKAEIKKAKDRFGRYIRDDQGRNMLRVHLHIVLNSGVPPMEIWQAWGIGYQKKSERLYYCREGFVKLATYLVKDTKKGKRKWNSTCNLEQPPPPKTLYAHREGTKSKVYDVAKNENLRADYFEKILPGYNFVESEATFNEHSSGAYLYSRMVLEDKTSKRRRTL